MKLITEQAEDLRYLVEKDDMGEKVMCIEGIFLQADVKNRNGRVYPKNILQKEVNRYMNENIANKNSYGELGHPQGPTINPDRISHLITEIKEDGSNFTGKAKVLSTPMGNIARSIMESGGKLAVSSRGIGSLKNVGDSMQVQEDFMLATAADIVVNPSAPDAYVQGILENVEYFYENGLLKEKEIEDDIDEAVKAKQLDENAILRALKKLKYALK